MKILKRIIKSKFVQSLKIIKIVYYPLYQSAVNKFNFNVASPLKTVETIEKNDLSLGRFGDGEMRIMFQHGNIGFQKYDSDLAQELFEAATSSKEYAIALPHGFLSTRSDNLRTSVFWWKYTFENRNNINKFVESSLTNSFLDASFSRTVTELKDKENIDKVIHSVKNLWENRTVLMVEGGQTKFGVGNDLLDNAKKIHRVIGPAVNAYSAIDDLESSIMELNQKISNPLILVALGPTATVLVHRLALKGVQAVDIGHFDLQYEYYLRGAFHRVNVANKYDNELGTTGNAGNKKNHKYEEEIYKRFL